MYINKHIKKNIYIYIYTSSPMARMTCDGALSTRYYNGSNDKH